VTKGKGESGSRLYVCLIYNPKEQFGTSGPYTEMARAVFGVLAVPGGDAPMKP